MERKDERKGLKEVKNMNPVFVFLVILAAALLWMLCAGIYKYIGGFFNRMFNDVTNEMKIEEEESNE